MTSRLFKMSKTSRQINESWLENKHSTIMPYAIIIKLFIYIVTVTKPDRECLSPMRHREPTLYGNTAAVLQIALCRKLPTSNFICKFSIIYRNYFNTSERISYLTLHLYLNQINIREKAFRIKWSIVHFAEQSLVWFIQNERFVHRIHK